MQNNKACGRETFRGDPSGNCFFHAESGKDQETFQARFLSEVEAAAKVGVLDCTRFVFPELSLPPKFQFNMLVFMQFCRFTGPVSLYEVTFHRGAYLFGSTFEGLAIFNKTLFKEQAMFQRAEFQQPADFGGSTFAGNADFHSTTFNAEAYFNSVSFNRVAEDGREHGYFLFDNATFGSLASFRYSKFGYSTSFRECRFLGRAEFADVTLADPTESLPSLDFSRAFVAEEDGLRFLGQLGDVFAPLGPARRPLSLWGVKFAPCRCP